MQNNNSKSTKEDLVKFKQHKYNVEKKGGRFDKNGNKIEFKLTLEEWLDIWQSSGHYHERGHKKGQYCMSRVGDLGHYEVGNVFIQPIVQNTRDANLGKPCSEEAKAKISAANSGRFISQEIRDMQSRMRKGVKRGKYKPRTPEQKAAMSARQTGKKRGPCSEARRLAIKAAWAKRLELLATQALSQDPQAE
jgi:hypothetical protein